MVSICIIRENYMKNTHKRVKLLTRCISFMIDKNIFQRVTQITLNYFNIVQCLFVNFENTPTFFLSVKNNQKDTKMKWKLLTHNIDSTHFNLNSKDRYKIIDLFNIHFKQHLCVNIIIQLSCKINKILNKINKSNFKL